MAAAGAAHRRRGLHRSQLARRRTEGFRSVRLCPAIKDRAQWRVYGEPAVGNKERAGNERRLSRGEEKRCIRHIFRLAQASQKEELEPRPYKDICELNLSVIARKNKSQQARMHANTNLDKCKRQKTGN